jgi:hypothetical protein
MANRTLTGFKRKNSGRTDLQMLQEHILQSVTKSPLEMKKSEEESEEASSTSFDWSNVSPNQNNLQESLRSNTGSQLSLRQGSQGSQRTQRRSRQGSNRKRTTRNNSSYRMIRKHSIGKRAAQMRSTQMNRKNLLKIPQEELQQLLAELLARLSTECDKTHLLMHRERKDYINLIKEIKEINKNNTADEITIENIIETLQTLINSETLENKEKKTVEVIIFLEHILESCTKIVKNKTTKR